MSHRTQIILTDEQYERLQREASATGVGIGELVRRAIDLSFGLRSVEERVAILHSTAGAWKDREGTSEDYVELLRPGLGHRLPE
jgi:hypothetical protein